MQRSTWRHERDEALAEHGMVAAQQEIAADVGLRTLENGGNAVDAAVATAFAAGVVEPYMSGIGGGGMMVVHLAERRETVAIDYGLSAPRAARPDMYELAGDGVRNDANVEGSLSVAVPGTVAGLAVAAERYGTLPWHELIQPAIELARSGFPVDWHTSLKITQELALLNRYPSTRAIFTDDGHTLPPMTNGRRNLLVQTDLADLLEAIAVGGAHAFYHGEIARRIGDGMREINGIISEEDLASYHVRVSGGLRVAYRGKRVVTTDAPSGGPSVLQSLRLLDGADLAASGHNTVVTLHELIESFRSVFVDRYAYLADPSCVELPLDTLLSEEYARERAATFGDLARPAIEPGTRERLGLSHDLAGSMPGYGKSSHTTHLSVIDEHGNAVALTQTVVGLWGSGVVLPGTGMLLNNGMLNGDPEPGRPNSIQAGKRPLSNMAPVLVFDGDRIHLVLGAVGGRKIMNAVTQIISNVLDHDMGIQAAIAAPRIDCSMNETLVDNRIAPGILDGLRERGHTLQLVAEEVGHNPLATPNGILVDRDGVLHGGVSPFYPAMAAGH